MGFVELEVLRCLPTHSVRHKFLKARIQKIPFSVGQLHKGTDFQDSSSTGKEIKAGDFSLSFLPEEK